MKVVYKKSMLERLIELRSKATEDGLIIDYVELSELEHDELKNNLRKTNYYGVAWSEIGADLINVYGITIRRKK